MLPTGAPLGLLANELHLPPSSHKPHAPPCGPRSQDPTYPRNWREALALSPWASTWAPAAVMRLLPSLERKTEGLRKRTGQQAR